MGPSVVVLCGDRPQWHSLVLGAFSYSNWKYIFSQCGMRFLSCSTELAGGMYVVTELVFGLSLQEVPFAKGLIL